MPEFNRAELHAGLKIFVPHHAFPDGAVARVMTRELRPRRPLLLRIKCGGARHEKMGIATQPRWGEPIRPESEGLHKEERVYAY